MHNNESGFTLIELLIVVVIIAILAGIAVSQLGDTKTAAYVASMKADLHTLIESEESYYFDNQTYADNLPALSTYGFKSASEGVTVVIDSGTATGWGATATHRSTGKVCRIAYGSAAAAIPKCN